MIVWEVHDGGNDRVQIVRLLSELWLFLLLGFLCQLLKSLCLMQSWNGELISPKTQQKSLMAVICLSNESS